LLKPVNLKNLVESLFYITKQTGDLACLSCRLAIKILAFCDLLANMTLFFIEMKALLKALLTNNAIAVKNKAACSVIAPLALVLRDGIRQFGHGRSLTKIRLNL
jgi:hypothetical protein